MLVLAGPGSGKTTVITHRVKYMLEHGRVNGSQILVITFTKAAAGEMKSRFEKIMGYSSGVTFGTFHSVFFMILRQAYGYNGSNIILESEKYQIIRSIIEKHNMEYNGQDDFAKNVIAEIGLVKSELTPIGQYHSMNMKPEDFRIAYREYEEVLRANNKIDFDDMLVFTYELLRDRPDIRRMWQQRFRYILIDEFQDINRIQYQTVKLLLGKEHNIFAVGDDDQSVYGFRGADTRIMLGFPDDFPDTRMICLSINYRCSSAIVESAGRIIKNNKKRYQKEIRSAFEKSQCERVHVIEVEGMRQETDGIIQKIREMNQQGIPYLDIAILYRTNAQSRIFEEKFIAANIPYKLVGGVNFYARKEIKDLLCYLKTIDNARDDLAVQRIINVPKRGIGATTLGRVQDYADNMGISLYEALRVAEEVPSIGRSLSKIDGFVTFIQMLKSKADVMTVEEILQEVIDSTGYVAELEAEDTEESRARIENIDELISKTVAYQEAMEEQNQSATLSGFLEEVALVADIDTVDPDQDYVLLMTLHSAKGLEFPKVFMVGMEDGIFPSHMTISYGDDGEMEEERRLCYVGITRAMKDLTLTCAQQRMIRGETQYNRVSRFVREIPRELVDLGHTIQEKKPKVEELIPTPAKYSKMKEILQGRNYKPREFKVTKANSLDYEVGDTVRHIKFGVGIVKEIVEGGRDYEVTVEFDKVGVKKMFASFAKLKKI